MIVNGDEFEIANKAKYERRDNESRRQFLLRKWQQVLKSTQGQSKTKKTSEHKEIWKNVH